MSTPPTEDQLLAMRYADGELEPGEREAFERRLANEEPLRREVSELQRLEVLAREVAPPEPGRLAVAALERGTLHRLLGGLGWTLACAAAAGLLLLAGLELAGERGYDREAGLLALALLVGLLLLLVRTLRERLARLPHDPYRDVRQ